jgi:hypothetical protein
MRDSRSLRLATSQSTGRVVLAFRRGQPELFADAASPRPGARSWLFTGERLGDGEVAIVVPGGVLGAL